MAERVVDVGGVELCTEPFGDPADPPVVLIMGAGHGVARADWDAILSAILEHTGGGR